MGQNSGRRCRGRSHLCRILMSQIYDIAHRYVDAIAALDPNLATAIGVPGHEREMTDFSPEGPAAIAALNRRTVGELRSAQVEDRAIEREGEASARTEETTPLDQTEGHDRDRIASDVMLER